MTEDEVTDDEDNVSFEEERRKQVRKVLLVGALLILALALLCIINIAFWVIGYKTLQTADARDWFVLVGASAMLIGILLFVSLVVYALSKNRRARIQRKLVRAWKNAGVMRLFAFAEWSDSVHFCDVLEAVFDLFGGARKSIEIIKSLQIKKRLDVAD